MVIDLVAVDSYMMINRRAAQVLGLPVAVYLSEVLNIGKTVVRKQKYDENGFFKLDRNFIERQTTIEKVDQLAYDSLLQKNGILEISPEDKNKVMLHADTFMMLITTEDETVLKNLEKVAKTTKTAKKESKKEAILQMLKDSVQGVEPEVKVEIDNWIDVVYEKGVCKRVQVVNFVESLKEYSESPTVQKDLLKILIINGWKDVQFAINRYEDRHKHTVPQQQESRKVATVNSINQVEYF